MQDMEKMDRDYFFALLFILFKFRPDKKKYFFTQDVINSRNLLPKFVIIATV